MNNLKNTQKKTLSQEIIKVVMDYMIGLNEENRMSAHKTIKKSAKKIVRLYYSSIKQQLKELKKVKEKKAKETVSEAPVISGYMSGNTLPNNKKAIIL